MNITGKITLIIALTGITMAAHAGIVTRSVPLTTTDIRRVYFTGSAELHLTQGEDEYIKLTAPEELLSNIKPRIKGRSLYLGSERKPLGNGSGVTKAPIRFDVQLKQIDAVRILGSAHVWLGDLRADRLKVILAGNSRVTAQSIGAWEVRLELAGNGVFKAGRIETGETRMRVTGSGDLNIAELQTGRAGILVAGSGDISLASVKAAKLETNIAGSADINLKGKVDTQELVVTGSGDYKAPDLISNQADIEVRGSGDIDVNVQKQLTAELSRGADLVYHGGSGLDVDISGEGKSRHATIDRTGK